ncbi:hypothetical protein GUITHDRAFT_114061 [Guillardia theta CCMP2712]|uniref:SAM domain-containing protein n=1 Tax=Guillardia theta (strain CCMP2712) TaxID=905079 RepID=L1IVG5_GUITC|nr:hypothetical protein GUITHDRAFT_114061 [Guillardia theta CCMP2712]EKX39810.1 hypothetical protein GUITHDRAFT_114061 [Guillardia theta CCMP2712]|eukprot:XP_005826790.1 hypothetical protein GUITHDRAFT_114061 [Guillardia theta CCMP2712]
MSDGREEMRDENPRLTIPKLNMRPKVNHHHGDAGLGSPQEVEELLLSARVHRWLMTLGLEECMTSFAQKGIRSEDLVEFSQETEEMLQSMGVRRMGDRAKLRLWASQAHDAYQQDLRQHIKYLFPRVPTGIEPEIQYSRRKSEVASDPHSETSSGEDDLDANRLFCWALVEQGITDYHRKSAPVAQPRRSPAEREVSMSGRRGQEDEGDPKRLSNDSPASPHAESSSMNQQISPSATQDLELLPAGGPGQVWTGVWLWENTVKSRGSRREGGEIDLLLLGRMESPARVVGSLTLVEESPCDISGSSSRSHRSSKWSRWTLSGAELTTMRERRTLKRMLHEWGEVVYRVKRARFVGFCMMAKRNKSTKRKIFRRLKKLRGKRKEGESCLLRADHSSSSQLHKASSTMFGMGQKAAGKETSSSSFFPGW